ncbi:MAG: hypothetical protein HY703_11980 [Gemmatimonadetes bacterium]|nr:hypothetical protein [Gemmatimonadota bacterium]
MPLAFLQAAPAAQSAATLTWPEVLTALAAATVALVALGFAVAGLLAFRSLARLMRSLNETVKRLGPRAEPLLENASRVASDASRISDSVRHEVVELLKTVEDINQQLRAAAEGAQERVQHFAAVLDVVQEEAEDLFLDAAAAARGLHASTRSLRRLRRRRH